MCRHHNHFTALFPALPGLAGARRELLDFMVQGKACIDTKIRKKNLLNTNTSSTCPHNMVNFGQITAKNCWRVWGTPANLNRFCVLAALLHGTPAVGFSQTLRRWTEGATYIRQGGHHVGHWPTFLVCCVCLSYFWVVMFVLTTMPSRRWNMETILMPLDRGGFVVVQLCSSLSMRR